MSPPFRKTKIVCTIGPAVDSPEQIRRLIEAGMDVARLNFSHGNHDSHHRSIQIIRDLSRLLGKEVGILQDLCGPKIRLGQLKVPEKTLKNDDIIALSPHDTSSPDIIPINYPFLLDDVVAGDRILLADGGVELRVEKKDEARLTARVIVGGVIQSHKGVNLPSSSLRIPAFTEKDRADLIMGLNHDVDFVALSFVRHENDLGPIREILEQREHAPLLIAKIEKPQAVERLDAILDKVDGVMVARGDLGVEMPLEEVPMIQKRIIRTAGKLGKPVITATQMLRSMMENPRPTRAEATDVANAVLDGTDALMLSDETAMGKYPIESVRILDRISRATEPHIDWRHFMQEPISDSLPPTEAAISRSACWLAHDLSSAAIVAFTSSGSTARLVARLRPSRPVIALTPHDSTQRQLHLSWGVIPAKVTAVQEADEMFALAGDWVLKNELARKGDNIVLTAGIPVHVKGSTNLLKVITI
ncbi:MAG: pyruvate kinase [Deltaproteobacteria bacterium]|nr:pyruvate kinase [Deltaproteobacteria bacterium]